MDDNYDIVVRIRITAKGSDSAYAFGLGTAQLLEGVRDFKSLNRAAKELGMAYSKAWTSLRNTEAQLGVLLIERKGPAGSCLTPAGEDFLRLYNEMLAASEHACLDVLKLNLNKKP